jgi:hypothetical protein
MYLKDMQKLSNFNNKKRYLLVVIDALRLFRKSLQFLEGEGLGGSKIYLRSEKWRMWSKEFG